ncbi:acyl-homoserine-lactone synthase TraI [Ancylobacter defluvii]|uniref:Acyl-homoserine-lactone synthase n=1 Tax=Ancylobacter defluvii TaxID=1282440 RepID=A0A9W6JUA8_9HYPH|nr:acyl-homoserine-lactone synthase TraI [Ancylobacter defluvii]MBS7590122.1 GNAT family N-acetyltransferase [Ancylobacter defluvii]GLK82746.1 acyl-homoserine-lactone synthase [Ancylobacter defluvii]
MRIQVVTPAQYETCADLLAQMRRLRAAVFSGRLEWDVTIENGEERDQYDDEQPSYVLAVTASGRVAGCCRLLPAVGPTMLERTFPQLLANGALDTHAAMIESSRFCVDTTLATDRAGGLLHQTTLLLFAGIIEWSMANGHRELVTATDLRFERILKRAGWPMKRLGEPVRIGNTMAVAGALPIDVSSLRNVRPVNYQSELSENALATLRSAA